MKPTSSNILAVAVTGGIASGKSSVCRLLEERGARVLDADAIGREVVEQRPGVLSALVQVFGTEILLPSGGLNRKRLARLAFSDKENLDRLNRIVHPFLVEEIRNRTASIERQGFTGIVVTDAALIFEWNLVEIFDAIVVVSCSEESQLRRICYRDSLEAGEALSRIRSQIPQAKKVGGADFHIVNDGSLAELEEKVEAVWKKLIELLETKRGGRA